MKRNRSHTQTHNKNNTTNDTTKTTAQQHNTRHDKNSTTNDHTKNQSVWDEEPTQLYHPSSTQATENALWSACVRCGEVSLRGILIIIVSVWDEEPNQLNHVFLAQATDGSSGVQQQKALWSACVVWAYAEKQVTQQEQHNTRHDKNNTTKRPHEEPECMRRGTERVVPRIFIAGNRRLQRCTTTNRSVVSLCSVSVCYEQALVWL